MCRNILASLIVNSSRVYKALPTACLTYFHLRRTSVVCVLEDMVTSFPYVSIVSVKKLFYSPGAYFIFVIVHFSVWFVYWCLFLSFSFLNSCVVMCCFLSNKENKEISDGRARVTRDLWERVLLGRWTEKTYAATVNIGRTVRARLCNGRVSVCPSVCLSSRSIAAATWVV